MASVRDHSIPVVQLREWAVRGRLFAVLDATDTPSVPIKARELGEDAAVSLYRGRAEDDLWSIAPFLVRVDEHTLTWITETLWSEPWGILLLADESLEDLRLHLRRFLVVEGPNDESWYFRFYDPRVLVRYLPTCTGDEAATFFGPIRAFGVTDPATYGVTVLTTGEPQSAGSKPPTIVRARAS